MQATLGPLQAASSDRDDRAEERTEFVTLAEAARLARRHISSVKNLALAGTIRTRWLPGDRVRYSRSDAQRVASAG